MPSAMILSAGLGERLRPITDQIPKALVEVDGTPLIVSHIHALGAAGMDPIVVNLSYRGEQIREALGDGHSLGVRILYSQEPEPPLGTGGGIFQALPLLGPDPFWVVNTDVYTDYSFAQPTLAEDDQAHLVLVDNPPHNPQGDFALSGSRVVSEGAEPLTFAGIGFYRPQLFDGCAPGAFPLAPILRDAIREDRISGEHYQGRWIDIGTPERLEMARSIPRTHL